jgi:hypothetical protein
VASLVSTSCSAVVYPHPAMLSVAGIWRLYQRGWTLEEGQEDNRKSLLVVEYYTRHRRTSSSARMLSDLSCLLCCFCTDMKVYGIRVVLVALRCLGWIVLSSAEKGAGMDMEAQDLGQITLRSLHLCSLQFFSRFQLPRHTRRLLLSYWLRTPRLAVA